jgi:predicted transcriptional regulator
VDLTQVAEEEKPPVETVVFSNGEEKSFATVVGGSVESAQEQALTIGLPKGRTSVSMRHRAICHMAALGIKVNKIAQTMGINPSRVSTILNSPKGREMVQEIQTEFFTNDPAAVFRAMAPKAARVVYKIMNTVEEKGSTRLAAASTILDRAYGKPQQEIKHEGSLVKDLFAQLDAEKKAIRTEGRTITDAEIVEPVLDATDQWVKENL